MHQDVESEKVLTCLAGEFTCWLTVAETNEWHEFASQREEFRQYVECCDRLRALELKQQGSGDLDLVEAVISQRKERRRRVEALYPIAKEWYEGLKRRREEAETAGATS